MGENIVQEYESIVSKFKIDNKISHLITGNALKMMSPRKM